MGVLKEIGKPLGAFYPNKSFNQPIASVSLCTSARSFFFSMSIASRYTRISFAKSPPISARRCYTLLDASSTSALSKLIFVPKYKLS